MRTVPDFRLLCQTARTSWYRGYGRASTALGMLPAWTTLGSAARFPVTFAGVAPTSALAFLGAEVLGAPAGLGLTLVLVPATLRRP